MNSAIRHVLAVNPGSTSSKLALFENERQIAVREVCKNYEKGLCGEEFDRKIEEYAADASDFVEKEAKGPLAAVVGRGGFLNRRFHRVEGGIYAVAKLINGEVQVMSEIVRGVVLDPELEHPCNLGIPIAARLAREFKTPAFSVDPVVSDDFPPMARLSGYAPTERRSAAHALSVKALGDKAARKLGVEAKNVNFVVAHLGGGMTVAALSGGKMVDNNIALLGGGPFTPQRVGSLPMKALIDLCYGGQFSQTELERELTKKGGLTSYLGSDDARAIEDRIKAGDSQAKLVIEAMAYQVSKEIGAMAVAADGEITARVFSGGLCRFEFFMAEIERRTAWIAPALVFPETLEMEAMALGALKVLNGEEKAKEYSVGDR